MSPATANALKPGDHIAFRGAQDPLHFTHIGRVTKKTKAYFWITFADDSRPVSRIQLSDLETLRGLRTADLAEVQGYKRNAS